jgi:DegV family protein with EDD domain
MSRIAVVTDSTAGLDADLLDELDISVIPLNVHWGDDNYKDGVTLDAVTFYQWLQERQDFPKTSQPSAGEFMDFFDDVAKRFKTDTILGVFISSDLSGTYASAMLAKNNLPEMHIEIFDSRSVSMGAGFMAMIAAKMAAEGVDMDAIVNRLQAIRENSHLLFAVDTLEFLHRGGRIGGAARLLGTALNLKPLLEVRDGRVEALEKVRRRRKSIQRVVEVAVERLQGQIPEELAILHTGEEKDLGFLTDLINEHIKPRRFYASILTPVVGTHGGPGSIAIAFYTENGK